MRFFSRRLPAKPSVVAEIRRDLTAWAQISDPQARGDLFLAVSEVVSNSVRHGPAGGHITVEARVEQSCVRVDVCDDGTGARIGVRLPDAEGGRGLKLLDAVSEAWGVSHEPTCVWFTVRTGS